MKLNLPRNLLAALLLCLPAVAAEAVVNPIDDGGVTHSGSNYFLSQVVTWQQDYNYDQSGKSTVLSVGTKYGDGTLNIENASTVNVAGSLHVGGWGWGSGYDAAVDPPHDGQVYVGQGSTLNVGTAPGVDATNSQLNIGAGGKGATGSLVVDGGTVTTNYALNVGLGAGASGELIIKNGGKVTVQGDATNASTALYVGYYPGSEGKVIIEGEGSVLEVGAPEGKYAMTYLGLGDASGTIEVRDGATLDLTAGGSALSVLGYDALGSGTINVTGGNLVTSDTYVGYAGDGAINVSAGADVDVEGMLLISGWNAGKTGAVTVEGSDTSFSVAGNTFVGNAAGTQGQLNITDGATADLAYVAVLNDSEVRVEGGATATAETVELVGQSSLEVSEGSSLSTTGDLYVGANASVTLRDSAEAASTLDVQGTYTNKGSTTMELTNGGSFTAGTVANTGSMDVQVEEGSTFKVEKFVNAGEASINAAANTTCELGTVELYSDMQLAGEGSFKLGSSTTETVFTVSGNSPAEASSTCIDISTLGGSQFTIDVSSDFTFYFTDDIKAALIAQLFTGAEMELTVIKGCENFILSELERDTMLSNTTYTFVDASSTIPSVYEFQVTDAAYVMVGNDLVWKGTIKAIPEPATATLSLLALAALAARRRRY